MDADNDLFVFIDIAKLKHLLSFHFSNLKQIFMEKKIGPQ